MRPVTDRAIPAAAETLVWFPVSGLPEVHQAVWLGLESAAVHTLCSGAAVQSMLAGARVGKTVVVEVEPGRHWELKPFFRVEEGLWCQILHQNGVDLVEACIRHAYIHTYINTYI